MPGKPETHTRQRKDLIRKLVKELRVINRDEIVPTYRVPALVRAPGDQVELPGIEPPELRRSRPAVRWLGLGGACDT